MDGERFDTVARRLAARRSRRTVAVALAAALATAVLGALGLAGNDRAADAQPGCRREGQPCAGNQQCCAGLDCAAPGPGSARRCVVFRPTPPPI